MIPAILLIKISSTKEREVYETLKSLPELADYHVLFGEYDIIMRAEVSDLSCLMEMVTEKIALIPGVIDVKVNLPPMVVRRN